MNKSQSKFFNTACLMDEALLLLLEKKDFEYITVKEICKKAGVNRSTFYLHYEKTSDLLLEAINLLNQKFLDSFQIKLNDAEPVRKIPKERLIFLTPDYLIPYLTFVRENKRVFKTIHRKPHIFHAEKVFENMCNELFNPILEKFNIPKEQSTYIFEYFTKGVLSIILKWVELDCKDSIDLIVQIILDCTNINYHTQHI